MLNISNQTSVELFQNAFGHHQAGRLAEAEALYRRLLAMDSQFADGWHLLGVLACQVGQNAAAVELIEKAIALNPRHPAYYSNLGEALRKAGDIGRAEQMLRQAMGVDGQFGDAYTNLAVLYLQQERYREAAEVLQRCVQVLPRNAGAWRLLGDASAKLGEVESALEYYRQALRIMPELIEARFNLGTALSAMGQPEEAAEAFRDVLAVTPEDQPARLMLADAYYAAGKMTESVAEYQQVLKRDPRCAQAHAGMANGLRAGDRVDEAIEGYRKALELQPDHAVTRANLAFALRDQARMEECEVLLREALEQRPESAAIRSGLIFTLLLNPRVGLEAVRKEQELWNQRHVDVAGLRRHEVVEEPGRRLRVGYVSADFRNHPVGRFMLPLMKSHDREQVEVYCYSATGSPDGFTRLLQGAADCWRNITSMTDEQAAEVVRQDQVDILVDLCNHTINNRLLVMARKPAPVQVSYLAYNAGTGVRTIDWRLTDPYIDPAGVAEERADFERPLRLAETYWCYEAHAEAPEVGSLPAERGGGAGGAGAITFGSFNYFSKVHDGVLEVWARVLSEMPTARLMLHVPVGSRQNHLREFFAARGISPERLVLVERTSAYGYFANHHRVDMALDPFPWGGGTTTCDALYMGVPVLTLAGNKAHETYSRGGASLMTNLGMPEWIARSPEEYVRKAREFGEDVEGLRKVRAGLRERMRQSVVMNAPRFSRSVEAAFRRAWVAWCESPA